MDRLANKRKSLNIIYVLNFLVPPVLNITIGLICKIVTYELLISLLTTWPLYVFLLPFMIGVPVSINSSLGKLRKLEENGNTQEVNDLYTSILRRFTIISPLYGICAIPICYLNNFGYELLILATIICLFYPFAASSSILLKFYEIIDAIFYGSSVSKSFSIKNKFRLIASLSVLGGIGVLITGSYTLFWRYIHFPEMGLSLEEITIRICMIGVIVIALQLLPNLMIGAQFSKLFSRIGNFVGEISSKDLTRKQVFISSRDEFGRTAAQLNSLRDTLHDIVKELANHSQDLQKSGGELKGMSSYTSDSANNLASSSEEIAASIEEISSNINLSAESASRAAKINKNAEESLIASQRMVDMTFENIQLISQKVELIEEVANETNYLAINAYIEAAGAGSDGAGFSVIAKQVRSLADKTKRAAREIGEMSKICLEHSVASKLKIDETVEISRETLNLSNEIAGSSVEQLMSIEHINSAIQEFNNSTQYLASSSQELALTSVNLDNNSLSMVELIDEFKK